VKETHTIMRTNRIQRRVIGLWLKIASALRLPRHVQGGVAWALGLPPLAGASGEGGAGNDPPPPGDGGGGGGAGGGGDGGGNGGGDVLTIPKSEWDNLQRERRESADALKKLQDAEAERQRKADEEAGNYREIAEREKARADAAEAEKTKLAEERQADARDRRVERIARRLNFRDPTDVTHRLSADVLDDDSKVEKALKDVAKEKPYLVTDGEVPRTRDLGNGDGDGGTRNSETEPTGPDRLARAYANTSKT
jgi:hypothetical protein